MLELSIFLPSLWLGSGKRVFLEDKPLLRGKCFKMVSLPLTLLKAQGNFSIVFILRA